MKNLFIGLVVIVSIVMFGGWVDRMVTGYNNTHVTLEMADRCSAYVSDGGSVSDCD